MNAITCSAQPRGSDQMMPHPTTWTRVLGHAGAAHAIESAIQPLLVPTPTSEVAPRANSAVAIDGKTLRSTIPHSATQGVHLVTAHNVTARVPVRQLAVSPTPTS